MIKACLVAAALLLATASAGFADGAYPTHPIRFIVPFAAGGGTDGQCRVLAEAAGKRLGQAIVVENLTGAGGTIGFNMVARADPDGYTILSATPGFAINPFIQKDIAYNPARDFAPVIEATTSPVVMVVAGHSPIHTVQDVLDLARREPGHVRYGSAGIGSIAHLSGALFASLAQLKLTHIPYRGSDPALIDLMAGRLQFQIDNTSSVLPQIRSGQLRAIAVGTAEPSKLLPEVPTIAQTVKGYESSAWLGILVPVRTPRPIVDRLNAAFDDSLADPQVQKALSAFGVDLVGGKPEVFGRYLIAKSAELKVLAKTANLVPQ
jgi:tripartite-type tricarboxylate transporter receptor subunit TctC